MKGWTNSRALYLAGPSAEIPRVMEAADLARSRGWHIHSPWWEHIEESRRLGWMSDAELPRVRALAEAVGCLAAIDAAARVVIMAKRDGGLSTGSCGELCYAVAVSRVATPPPAIVIVGDPMHVFGTLVPVVRSLEEAFPLVGTECRHQKLLTVGPHGRCADCGAVGPFDRSPG